MHTKVIESFQKDQGSNDPSTISQKKEFTIWKPNGKEKVEGVKKVNEVGNLNEVAHVCHIILKNDWKENAKSIATFVFECLWLDLYLFFKWNKFHIMHFQTTFSCFLLIGTIHNHYAKSRHLWLEQNMFNDQIYWCKHICFIFVSKDKFVTTNTIIGLKII